MTARKVKAKPPYHKIGPVKKKSKKPEPVDEILDELTKPNIPAGPYPKTFQEELALAVFLWRAVRIAYHDHKRVLRGRLNASVHPQPNVEKVNETAIEMAKRMGVKAEFFKLLFEYPVCKLYMVSLDPWPLDLRHRGMMPPDGQVLTVESGTPIEEDE